MASKRWKMALRVEKKRETVIFLETEEQQDIGGGGQEKDKRW